MELGKKPIFQTENPAVVKVFNEAENYKIKFHSDSKVQKNLCVIYFSSNELYYPNTSKAFESSILTKDKFEWQRNFLRYAHKHIFVRDVQKQWYIEGINKKYNSPSKLLDLLKELTAEFRIYTVGSSAGGFAALLFGNLLKADRIYAFNAQLNLNLIMQDSNPVVNPLLFKYKDSGRSKYYVIENFLEKERDCFYFHSSKSNIDIKQYNSLHNKSLLIRVPFKTSNHGFPFLRHNLMYVLGLPKEKLLQLAKKNYHPVSFAASIDGWSKTIRIVITAVINRLKKKLKEKRASV